MKNVTVDSVVQSFGQRITAFARWSRAKILSAKQAVFTRFLLVSVGVLGIAAASAAAEPAGLGEAPEKLVSGKQDVSPEAAWQAIRPRLEQADRDSAKAVEAELAAIKDFFAERKQGARRFAEEVLGWGGKLRAAAGMCDRMADAILEFFGSKPDPGDNFTFYIQCCFREHVLDAGQLKKAIKDSVAGYAAEMRRIEGKLLLDLRADLDLAALPEIRAGGEVAGESGAMIAEVRDAAVNDLVAWIGKEAVSWVLGNAIADRLTCEDDPALKKGVVNVGVGMAVDKALNAGLANAGYDPEGALAARIAASLDRMRDRVINGEPEPKALVRFPILSRALSVSEFERYLALRDAKQGLRQRLLSIHAERSRLRAEALRRLVFGPGASR